MLGLVILVLLVLGGWYLQNGLKQLEMEIRRDMEEKNTPADPEPESERSPESPPEAVEPASDVPLAAEEPEAKTLPLEDRLLLLVAAEPGLAQPEIYQRLGDYPRKTLQTELLKLARAGRLRREKAGGSYRLFRS